MSEPTAHMDVDAMREEGQTARYSHFEAVLDCNLCGDEIRIDGDVHNGQVIECETCGHRVAVENR